MNHGRQLQSFNGHVFLDLSGFAGKKNEEKIFFTEKKIRIACGITEQ